MWIKSLGLFIADKYILHSKSQWLNDSIINCFQTLLKSQYPNFQGFQNTQLRKTLKFETINWEQPFIQILHVNGNHWIVVSNIYSEKGCIDIYDSQCKYISKATLRQICCFLNPNIRVIKFGLVNIQWQPTDCECGLFAIAVATELANGNNPSKFRFSVEKMRQHVLECFENENFVMFPSSDRVITEKYNKVVVESLFCTCYMPFDEKQKMRSCDHCQILHHLDCFPSASTSLKWHCPTCTDHLNWPHCDWFFLV